MLEHQRKSPNELAHESLLNDNPTAWFEKLYAQADANGNGVPWAKMRPNERLVRWLDRHAVDGKGQSALVVGCGLGDDAQELARRGFSVTAFDVSKSAIALCKERFAGSTVTFEVADLFSPPDMWQQGFDFVYESITVQALPPDYQRDAMQRIADFVAPNSHVLVMTWAQQETRLHDGPPWLLQREAIQAYQEAGLEQVDYHEERIRKTPPVWYIEAHFRRP